MKTSEPAAVVVESTEVEVQIRGLMMDPVTNMPIIVLKDVASDLVLPIWVGMFEANAIALELEKTATPRPMTHDLLQNVTRGLDAEVTRGGGERAARRHVLCAGLDDAGGRDRGDGCTAVGCDCDGAAVGLPDLCEQGSDGEVEAAVWRGAVDQCGGCAAVAGGAER